MISHANDFRSLPNLIRPVVGRAPAARRVGRVGGRRAAAVGTPGAWGLGGVWCFFFW